MAQIEVHNPATGELVAAFTATDPADLAQRAARARAAQVEWAQRGIHARAAVMLDAKRWMVANRKRVIGTVIAETGKTYEDALSSDYGYTLAALAFWARNAARYLADERLPAVGNPVITGKRMLVRYVPRGLVGVIGPYNFPLANSFGDCIPALMAGNSAILKPSPATPCSALLMAEMFAAVGLPDDVFQVVLGDETVGSALVEQVDCVMFTGTAEVGRAVASLAAQRLIPCTLELGGKDAMIVCADADLQHAAQAAAYWACRDAGQVCTAIERVYVEAPVYDEFVERVVKVVRSLRQGVSTGPATADVGATIVPAALDLIERQIDAAVGQGARVLAGGHAQRGSGRYFEPTVVVDVDHSMALMRDETLGPVIPIMRVEDVAQAVEFANDSRYGLQASVWTQDLERGEQIARAVEAGAVCINDAQLNYLALNLPMGGWKQSGVGTRHGAEGIRKYCQPQSLLSSSVLLRREMFMFPYSHFRTLMLREAYSLRYRDWRAPRVLRWRPWRR